MLSDPGHFLYMMENYDKENLTAEMINKLKVYIEDPNFQPAKVRGRSIRISKIEVDYRGG